MIEPVLAVVKRVAVLTAFAALAIGASTTAATRAWTSDQTSTSSVSRQTCVWQPTAIVDLHRVLFDRLNSVAVVSPRMAWAVGDYFAGHEGGPHGAFIERWNGRRWRIAAAPIPRGSILWSVSASNAGDAWAVGQTGGGRQLIEHWDGARWRSVAAPGYGGILNGVIALTPHDAWAVGVRNLSGGGKTLIEHWNGTRWTVVSSPNPAHGPGRRPFAILQAVSALSPSDVWAAGYSGAGVPVTTLRTSIAHWDGRRWRIVPSPNVRSPGGVVNDILFSISGDRSADVWAVGSWGSEPGGYGGKGDHALALHWNGRRWSRTATPPIAPRALLSGVVARSGRAWAVGDRGLQPHQGTLIERWDGTRWSVAQSPAGFSLAAVTTSSSGTAFAVGERGRQPLAVRC